MSALKKIGPGKLLGAFVALSILLSISIATVNEFVKIDKERVHFQKMSVPNTELLELRKRESQTLNSYAVVDKESGVYRIPVSLAMELEVQDKGE